MRVWVTRDEEPDGLLSTALRDAGCIVVHEPVLARRIVEDISDVLGRLGPDDWLVLTSIYAIESVAEEPARVPRVAVISEPSRRAAEGRGLRVELVSPEGDGASLFSALRQRVRGGKVCYPRSDLATLPDAWPGVELICPVLYETVPRVFDLGVIDRVDVVAVVSPSAVDSIAQAVGKTGNVSLASLRFASIGRTTSRALIGHGVLPWLEAPERSFSSLAAAILARSRPATP